MKASRTHNVHASKLYMFFVWKASVASQSVVKVNKLWFLVLNFYHGLCFDDVVIFMNI